MSRTIRRKTARHARSWFVGRLEDVDRWDLKHYSATDPKKCLAKKSAHFHGDSYRPGNPPRWFVRHVDNRFTRAEAAERRRCLDQGCWEDHLPVCHIRSAAKWIWF